MTETKELTIEEVDLLLAKIPTRLTELDELIRVKTDELAKSRIRGLLTPPIHKSIRALEDERRELIAEQNFLTQERQNIEKATAQQAAETAAAEYNKLLAQINPLSREVINSLCALQNQLLTLEKIELDMRQHATVAGDLKSPMPLDALVINAGRINGFVDGALLKIISFNGGKDNLVKADIHIPDLYQEREKIWGKVGAIGGPAAPENVPVETNPDLSGFDKAMLKAAGLTAPE